MTRNEFRSKVLTRVGRSTNGLLNSASKVLKPFVSRIIRRPRWLFGRSEKNPNRSKILYQPERFERPKQSRIALLRRISVQNCEGSQMRGRSIFRTKVRNSSLNA